VVIAKRNAEFPLGLASFAPHRFAGAPSLHFVGLTWSVETTAFADRIKTDLAEIACTLPQARFVILANTLVESALLSQSGVPNIVANELIFADERAFAPARRPRVARIHDAVYNARLHHAKRHELARAIPNLLLIYNKPEASEFARSKELLPQACFANHDLNAGAYKWLNEPDICELLSASCVGLCLSATEGAMRASIEYRLCGLPVVSTISTGGRDRYLFGPHVRIVPDDCDSVAAAVSELKAKAFDPHAVREFVGQLIAFDRHNFLLNVNKLTERELGIRERFRSFAPFLRYPLRWRAPAEVFEPLDKAASFAASA
jgi:glycosyltransferase involved in cell wall biosynthesis